MLDVLFSDQKRINRMRGGLLGVYLDGLAPQLVEQGYASGTAMHKIGLVTDLGRWLEQQRLGIIDLNENKIEAFLKSRIGYVSIQRGDRLTLRCLLDQLRSNGKIPPAQIIKETVLSRTLREYTEYLARERCLSRITIDGYAAYIRKFLSDRFENSAIRLRMLRQEDTNEHMRCQAMVYARATLHGLSAALRSFFRFLYLRGDINTDLSSGVPSVAAWRLSTIPRFIKPDEVQKLLESCDLQSTTGQRDYAILLLLARLGLRAGEVVAMKLEDINWHAGEIMVRGKGQLYDRLPLTQDVGEALAKYLRHGRPRSLTRHVFVRLNAPHRGFASSSDISTIVRQAIDRVGIHPSFKGAHLLRHSLATNMLQKGASLAEIGEVLRHRCPTTTEIYSKVAIGAMSALAQPWPGDKA